MNSTILSCKNVTKSFSKNNKKLNVLNNINLEICPGEKILIFGRSGQGKSVLLSLLSGMDIPSNGEIWFNGKWFSSLSSKRLARLRQTGIGIIFQNLNLIPSWTALENVEASLVGLVNSAVKRRKLAERILGSIGLNKRLNHLPSEMSMGEQQRTAIARTLIRNPKLILADEPTGDLDNESASGITQLLYSYSQENNAALLVTSHGHFPGKEFDQCLELKEGILIPGSEQSVNKSAFILN